MPVFMPVPRLHPGLFSTLDDAAVETTVAVFHSDAQAASSDPAK